MFKDFAHFGYGSLQIADRKFFGKEAQGFVRVRASHGHGSGKDSGCVFIASLRRVDEFRRGDGLVFGDDVEDGSGQFAMGRHAPLGLPKRVEKFGHQAGVLGAKAQKLALCLDSIPFRWRIVV